MKNIILVSSIVLLLFVSNTKSLSNKPYFVNAVNGGSTCATCTVLVGLTEQLAILYNTSVENSLDRLCNYLPTGIFRLTCEQAVESFGPIIINGIYAKKTPDVICNALKFCFKSPDSQGECRLFPLPKGNGRNTIQKEVDHLEKILSLKGIRLPYKESLPNICQEKIFKRLCQYLDNIFGNQEPGVDIDNDGHSNYPALRGSSWKGKDCNDLNSKIRPGVKPTSGDQTNDMNCNGIFGVDPETSQSYEDKFCKSSKPIGVAVLGDSISAHFHIPEQWIDVTQLNSAVFEHLAFIIENELDWPELSASTGYMNTTWSTISGTTRSTYLNLFNRNKCNFRDYQNIARNGAATGSMIDMVKTLARNPKEDQPLLVVYSLVGNDVCNGHPDTFDHMTKPDEFYKNVVTVMKYLDTVLPNGSHVLVTGLANGSVLFDSVGDRIYPLGRLRNDIKYSDMYTYLSCLQISPCNGWMTTNATVRALTTNYAMMLSGILKNVTQSYKFKNFDMDYTDFPLDAIFNNWSMQGGQPWQLIEPVDGFHMNQIANALAADEYWKFLTRKHPDWLGPVNPFNDEITRIFGNQGGY